MQQAGKAFNKALRMKPQYAEAERELRDLERKTGGSFSSTSDPPDGSDVEDSGLRRLLKKKLF